MTLPPPSHIHTVRIYIQGVKNTVTINDQACDIPPDALDDFLADLHNALVLAHNCAAFRAIADEMDDWDPAECGCFTCLNDPFKGYQNPALKYMILCPQCGNKRCPHATDHGYACTGSNEPGQEGSRY